MPTVKHSSLCVRSTKKTSKPVLLHEGISQFYLAECIGRTFLRQRFER